MTQNTDTNNLSEEDRQALFRIAKAFGEMPFGGLANFTHTHSPGRRTATGYRPGPLTLVEIAENLESLVQVLERVSEGHEKERGQLQQHRDAIYGLRLFMNLVQEEDS